MTPPPAAGEIFAGKYRIEELLGTGGYGRVYRATQLPLGRSVALKTISTDFEDGPARFVKEAGFAQRLEHPNTVRLYDFGTTTEGQPYLVLELLRGQPLDALIKRRGTIDAHSALVITKQVCNSLMEAHGLGIVHRDIKPANVFITSHSGEPLFVKVLDFGLAKEIGRRKTTDKGTLVQGNSVGLTKPGEVMGTANYMPPEQVTGGELTAKSDLYAVGLVLAEMLIGQPVFQGASHFAIAVMQASPQPVPLPPQIEASIAGPIIRRAVEKRPEARYASAAEMAQDIERVLAEAKAPKPPSLSPRALVAIGLTLGLVLLGLGVGAYLIAAAVTGEDDRSSSRRRSDDDDERDNRSRKTSEPRRSASAFVSASSAAADHPTKKITATTRAQVESALVGAGFQILSSNSQDWGPAQSHVVGVSMDGCIGSVSLVRYPDEETARKSAAVHAERRVGRSARDGQRVLFIVIGDEKSPGDMTCNDAAFATLTN